MGQPEPPRVSYTQELRQNINQLHDSVIQVLAGMELMRTSQTKFEMAQQRLESSQQQLSIQVAGLPSRQEISDEFERHVSAGTYQADIQALKDRIVKLEESPQHTLSRVAVAVSIISVALNIAMTLLLHFL